MFFILERFYNMVAVYLSLFSMLSDDITICCRISVLYVFNRPNINVMHHLSESLLSTKFLK